MKTKLLICALFTFFFTCSLQAQWLQQISGTVAKINSIHCADTNVCMVVGATTTLRKTTNGGTTWIQQTSLGITEKTFVRMYNTDTIILGQVNGTFKQCLNGTTWSADIFGGNSSFELNDVGFISKTNFTAVGGNSANHTTGGRISTSSTNTGASWPSFINTSGVPTLFGIHVLKTDTFVACGGGAAIYKTTNGGATWAVKLNGSPNTTTLYDIHFVNDSVGYAGGGDASTPTTGGVIYKTVDKGETWVSASTGLKPNAIFGIHFVNADTGYAVGDGGIIQVTKNGGVSWTAQISPVTSALRKIHFPSKKIGYIAGDLGVILKTKTGGFVSKMVVNAGPDTAICKGSCLTLGTTAVTGGTKPYKYAWSPGGQTTTSIVVCPISASLYVLTVVDVNNDTIADSVSVNVHPTPTVSISGLDSIYCNLVSADTLIGSPTGGVFTGPGIASGDSVFNATVAGAGTHTVTYTFTDTTTCVFVKKKTVIVLSPPTPVQICLVTVDSTMNNTENHISWIKPVTTSIDSFKIYRLGSPSFNLIGAVSYSANSTFIDAGAGVTPKTNSHAYVLSIVDTCGIESIFSDTGITMHLAVPIFTMPATFKLNWTDYSGFSFTNYEIWRTINGGTSWILINTVAYAAGTKSYTDANTSLSSRYRIRATHPTGCGAYGYSLSNVTDDYTSVNEISLNNNLKVYPNPSHGAFKIEMTGKGFEVSGIKIYNLLGETVYQAAENKNVSEIIIPKIAPGIYHLEVRTDKGVANKKITIE